MPKEILESVDVRQQILDYLKDDDRSLLWLHDKIEKAVGENNKIPYGTLYSCLHQKLFKVSDENLRIINETLGTDFK